MRAEALVQVGAVRPIQLDAVGARELGRVAPRGHEVYKDPRAWGKRLGGRRHRHGRRGCHDANDAGGGGEQSEAAVGNTVAEG